jgi:hypothetical protein
MRNCILLLGWFGIENPGHAAHEGQCFRGLSAEPPDDQPHVLRIGQIENEAQVWGEP